MTDASFLADIRSGLSSCDRYLAEHYPDNLDIMPLLRRAYLMGYYHLMELSDTTGRKAELIRSEIEAKQKMAGSLEEQRRDVIAKITSVRREIDILEEMLDLSSTKELPTYGDVRPGLPE